MCGSTRKEFTGKTIGQEIRTTFAALLLNAGRSYVRTISTVVLLVMYRHGLLLIRERLCRSSGGAGVPIGASEPQVHPSYVANQTSAVARDFDPLEVSRQFGSEHSSWFHCQHIESAEFIRRISGMVSGNARVLSSPREKQLPSLESFVSLRCVAGLSRS